MAEKRQRGSHRKRGNSYEIRVYGGVDPLTGEDRYLTASTTDEREVEKIKTRLLAEVDQQRSTPTKAALGHLLDSWLDVHDADETTIDGYRYLVKTVIKPALGDVPIAKIDSLVLERFYAELRKCRRRCLSKIEVDHRTHLPHECRTVRHHRRPGRPKAGETHDCEERGCTVIECKPHVCATMAQSTMRQLHWILSGAMAAAVRWKWVPWNPMEGAEAPRRPAPNPEPPSAADAARIVNAAWERGDLDWGTLVWLIMITGARRGELVALQWRDLDLQEGVVELRRGFTHRAGKKSLKQTKTHQIRRIGLDDLTVELLADHRSRYEKEMRYLRGITAEQPFAIDAEAFVFSAKPDHSAPRNLDAVSHRYAAMCARLGIDSHPHAMRHYNATELLTSGVDLRTVAGRLGHGGGGSTTLKVYTAWSEAADKKAADVLATKVSLPPGARRSNGKR
ncbi:tyrosine-type recombinase/integrase [Microlunatus parietis]|uniref:Integrase n=1 Tax=Microlunatus parietis TaxID=682979 RepID=A0A7Y9I7U7_9ACTN|nr:tyrosine-type recombinase/integrase [Microlunatus parietis]NYE71904.1 integrase [Microlunatus parietis]